MGVKGIRVDKAKELQKEPKKQKRKVDRKEHDNLCLKALKWLKRHERNIKVPNCSIIAVDMVTVENETPDVIGWNSAYSVMIEVKVSRSDFLQDSKKPFRNNSEKGVGELRFYCCPDGLIKENEIPGNWGLLYLMENNKIEIVKKAVRQTSNLIAERNMLLSIIRRKNA